MKRNRSITYSDDNPIYFVTTTVTENIPVFFDEKLCDFVLKELDFYRIKYNYAVYGYVIMPTHIHLLLQQLGEKNISEFMRSFIGFSAKGIVEYYKREVENYFNQVGSGDPTLTENKSDVRVNSPELTAIDTLKTFEFSAKKYHKKYRYQVWQERFDDVLVWSEKIYNIKLDYIHSNPCKPPWSLVDETSNYKYSSARNYYLDDESVFRVDKMMW